jgi:hypothetical protein
VLVVVVMSSTIVVSILIVVSSEATKLIPLKRCILIRNRCNL